MKRTNGFQLERAPAGGQTLPPWAAALCGGLCAAGAASTLHSALRSAASISSVMPQKYR